MHKKIDLFHFGDDSSYDEYNPMYVYRAEGVPEILYLVAESNPYTLSLNDTCNQLNFKHDICEKAIQSLKRIRAISEQNETYKLNFPIFLERDVILLDDFVQRFGKEIGKQVVKLEERIKKTMKLTHCKDHDISRWLYHIIADNTFDGSGMDYLGDQGVISISKQQPDNRDYILIGYEDSQKVSQYSNRLFCSSNNYYMSTGRFNSFGDSNGNRKDMYRFFRRIDRALGKATEHDDLNISYIGLTRKCNDHLVEKCHSLVRKAIDGQFNFNQLNEEEQNLVGFLREMEYVTVADNVITCIVPVFEEKDITVLNDISNIIMEEICPLVRKAVDSIATEIPELTANKHEVNAKEIANELWHMLFGKANEYLMDAGFIASPEYKQGEGRYFRSVYFGNEQ